MDNVNPPTGQGPQEHSPTEPNRFTPGWPGAAQGAQGGQGYRPPPGGPQWQQGGPGPQPQPKKGWKRSWQSKRLRWTAGITAAVLLGAGGALAGLSLAGSGSGSSGSNSTQADALNTAITSTKGNCATPLPGSTARSGKHGCLRPSIRRVRGMYGQVSYATKSGTETLAFERGTVVSNSNSALVVKARNGTEWTWDASSSSLVRESGKPVSSSDLIAGAKVFVGGQVIGSSKDARLVVIHAKTASGGSSSSGTSGNSSSSSSSGSAT